MLNPCVNIVQIFFSHSNLKTTQMPFSSGLIKHSVDNIVRIHSDNITKWTPSSWAKEPDLKILLFPHTLNFY